MRGALPPLALSSSWPADGSTGTTLKITILNKRHNVGTAHKHTDEHSQTNTVACLLEARTVKPENGHC
jgi:hypothetical protein